MICHYCGAATRSWTFRRLPTFGGTIAFCDDGCLAAHTRELQALVRERKSLQWLQELKRSSLDRAEART